jgi:hypothetical protein
MREGSAKRTLASEHEERRVVRIVTALGTFLTPNMGSPSM